MSWWAWVGLLVLIGYFGFRVYRSLTGKETRYGPFQYTFADTPGLYWFFTIIDILGFAFLLTLLAMVLTS